MAYHQTDSSHITFISEHLKSRRTRQGLTQMELANLIESSQSRVAKMEAGDASVSLDLLIRSLLALGVTRKDLARMIAGSTGRSPA